MPGILVIHWDPAQAAERAARLRSQGFDALSYPARITGGLRAIRETSPDAILIDLTALPSYGRAIGAMLREQKSTRTIPLVFLEGDPAKTARVRELLPDATFAVWPRIGPALRRAVSLGPGREPMAPRPPATPLCQKLRIRGGAVVALLRAPADFEATLAPLPEGVRLRRDAAGADVILFFAASAAALGRQLPALAREVKTGRIVWLVWAKKTSAAAGGLSMAGIREMCGAAGLVDYKVCAVDRTWSAMAFGARRGRTLTSPTAPAAPWRTGG
ncbi:MAG: hypothetical protein LAP87_02625 [Acidobacteriia bacterium]|nr:hypothetical protein [Terriglobia bacterium]